MNRDQKFFVGIASAVALFLLIVLIANPNRQASPAKTQVVPTKERPSSTSTPVRKTNTPHPKDTKLPIVEDITPSPDPETPVAQIPLEFFVSPDGQKTGDGTIESPWPLQYALNQPNDIVPGSTIWLLGGEYIGEYVSRLEGAEGKPIIVRNFEGERAILKNDDLVLDISTSSYVYFWGLEITATENSRDPIERPESAYGVRINQGKKSHNIKFINLIVHDMPAQGFGWWRANSNSEIYGSLVYFNGVNQFDHGIYVNNVDGTKVIKDNIIFDNASHGIHAYGSSEQELNNIEIMGNTVFNNGSIGYTTTVRSYGIYKRNILIGGERLALNPVVVENMTYYPDNHGTALNLGYKAGASNAIVKDNYFAGGVIELNKNHPNVNSANNSIINRGLASILNNPMPGDGFLLANNEPKIFVRPNLYEAGRANITIYNWDQRDVVEIPAEELTKLGIAAGDRYQLHNAQDYFSDVILGTYNGKSISVPMTGRSVAQPLGLGFKPASTFPDFGAFVLISENEPSN